MADDEHMALDRFRDRLGGLERLFERLDERGKGYLDKDDATRLMSYSDEKTERLREDFVGRLGEFRLEVRDAFKHAEKEYAAALFKSRTELNADLMAQLSTLMDSRQPEKRNGIHPVLPYGVGGSALTTAVFGVLYILGLIPAGNH